MSKHTAIYVRVSSKQQITASQEPDLKRHAATLTGPVVWYTDTASGKTMQREAWKELEHAMHCGKVSSIVVWRLDRLGRTASGLTKLFDDLGKCGVNLVSLRDGIDLHTPAGRLMANVLASVAQYENEVRSERVVAGMQAAKAKGKRIGGGKKGAVKKVTPKVVKTIKTLKAQGETISGIGRLLGLSRPTVRKALNG